MLINEIESAQEKIYVEVYIFTEKRLRDALIAAHKR
jgi:phosphatidylserine/phosphatidylglycerophosphate/cardiolipin synthase-like enzyme